MDIMVYHAHTIGYDYTHGIECYSDKIYTKKHNVYQNLLNVLI